MIRTKRGVIWLQIIGGLVFTLLMIIVPPALNGRPFGSVSAAAVIAGVVGGAFYSLAMYVFVFRPRMRSLR